MCVAACKSLRRNTSFEDRETVLAVFDGFEPVIGLEVHAQLLTDSSWGR